MWRVPLSRHKVIAKHRVAKVRQVLSEISTLQVVFNPKTLSYNPLPWHFDRTVKGKLPAHIHPKFNILNLPTMANENSREYLLAKAIEDGVNTFGFNRKSFIDGFLSMHRTNQQSFVRNILVPVIQTMGNADFGTDPRNEASHELCARLLEVF